MSPYDIKSLGPVPRDLAGFQQISSGTIVHGDLLVWHWPSIPEWADFCVGHLIEDLEKTQTAGGTRIYRKIPVASHKPKTNAELGLPPVVADTFSCVDPAPILTTKPTNPKDIIGSDKLPLHLWPSTATALGSLALLDGALKYGRSNFRAVGVRASIYNDACRRHLDAWFEGEDEDPDSGLDHLGHALACIAVIVDARAAGKLNDDRMIEGGHRASVAALTPHVARLKKKHGHLNVKHYTIEDSPR